MGDAVCVGLALLASYQYRFHVDRIPIPGTEPPQLSRYVMALPVAMVLMLVTLFGTRSYRQTRGRSLLDEAYGVVGGIGTWVILALALMSLYRAFSYSRLVVLYTAVSASVLLLAFRVTMRLVLSQMRRRGIGTTRALVVGAGSGADILIHRLEMFPEYGYELMGVVDDELVEGEEYHRVPVVGGTRDLARLIMRHGVDQVFVALPQADHRQTLRLIKQCDETRAEFKIVPDLLEIITGGVQADDIDGIPLVGVRRSRLVGANVVVKRVFDVVLGVLLLIPGVPLMAAIALLIRLDSPGPVVYRQERVGRSGATFVAYKFRSMVIDAEADTGPVFATRDDPRITRLGRALRRTGLDEVPQVWNVLKGEMSLVGPRPERPLFVEQFAEEVPGYMERHSVLPGITGWAQLNDLRQDTPIEQRTIYDSYYVENWSLGFDFKILIATFFRVFFHRNAY